MKYRNKIICLIVIALASVLTVILLSTHNKQEARVRAPAVITVCPGNAFRVGLSPLPKIVSEVPTIAIGEEQQRTSGRTFRIVGVLKGDQLLEGDIITICPGTSVAGVGESFDSTLLLLNGKEKSTGYWAPEQLEYGVIPNKDGRYGINIYSEGTKYYSVQDIKKAIQDSQPRR